MIKIVGKIRFASEKIIRNYIFLFFALDLSLVNQQSWISILNLNKTIS